MPAQEPLVGVGLRPPQGAEGEPFAIAEDDAQRPDDVLGDLLLDGEHVAQLALEHGRPEMAVVGHVDELDAHPHAIASVLEAELGPRFAEVALTSPTAPGVVRRWTTAKAFTDEISAARIYGGIHYRTSAVVGQTMGRQIGELAVTRYLKPIR